MTTPEKFRRRQRIEGVFLILLALASVGYGLWDSSEQRQRDDCLVESFRAAGEHQAERARLGEETTALHLAIDNEQSKVFTQLRRGISAEELFTLLEEFQEENARLDEEQRALLQEREETLAPPFPDGTCE